MTKEFKITGNSWAGIIYHPFNIGDKVYKTGRLEIFGHHIKYEVYKWGIFKNKYAYVIDMHLEDFNQQIN